MWDGSELYVALYSNNLLVSKTRPKIILSARQPPAGFRCGCDHALSSLSPVSLLRLRFFITYYLLFSLFLSYAHGVTWIPSGVITLFAGNWKYAYAVNGPLNPNARLRQALEHAESGKQGVVQVRLMMNDVAL